MNPSPFTQNRIPTIQNRQAYTVACEPMTQMAAYWRQPESLLAWNCLFVLPMWLNSWWSSFGEGRPPQIITVKHQGEPIGIAPLMIEQHQARFIGAPDVCDYQDMIIAPGREAEFFKALFEFLKNAEVDHLDLNPLHANATVVTALPELKAQLNCRINHSRVDMTYAMELPQSWEAYLQQLTGKQRHEIRRKLRRLNEAADVHLRVVVTQEEVADHIDDFVHLFKTNRPDKAAFMTDTMKGYFRRLAESLADAGLLKLYFLDLNRTPAAAAMCFDYGNTLHLYNNGYDRRFDMLSVGVMSKVLAIRDAIERNRTGFNFLKGSEKYKQQLGGQPLPVYRYRIDLY